MSGFEIAGVVLGAFPIFCEAASGLRGAFSDLKTWWQFEIEFEDLVSAIEREHIAFSQNLEILLSLLPIDDAVKERLLEGRDRALWLRPDIQAELRSAIQSRYYSWFVKEMESIRSALDGLHRLLCIQNGIFIFTPTGRGKSRQDMLEREMFRLRLSFLHDKDKLLDRVKDKNTALYAFLDRASHMASGTTVSPPTMIKRSNSSKAVQPVLAFQRYGTAMWKSLPIQWSCRCPGGHPFALAVGQYSSDRTDYPELCFELLVSKDTDVRVQVIPLETPMEVPQATSAKLPSQQEAVTELRTKLTIANHLRKLKWKGKNAMQTLILSTSAIETPKEPEKLRTDTLLSSLSVRRLLQHSRKKSSGSSERVASPPGLPSSMPPGARRVQFAGHDAASTNQPAVSNAPKTPSQDRGPITNLCDVLNSETLKDSKQLGYLNLDQTTRLSLHAYPPHAMTIAEMASLNLFIINTPSREARMRACLSMLTTLLVFGPTPWFSQQRRLDRCMTGNFLRAALTNPVSSTATILLPFASRDDAFLAPLGSAIDATTSTEATRAMLFNTGVFVLELMYGDKLENQPWRDEYISTKTRAANDATDLCTAMRWQKRTEEEFGYGIADAIRRCILCSFEGAPDLASRAFVQAVWEGVVKPVEDFLTAWSRGV
ncbi:hypothetical protein B0H66DRAFT_382704 [Apodospora peruviana]|uniref:Uncharacterized protein n=1 Tax=Apodospora peruviana TaxID=516989 RepID=A0AAE0HVU7_9PEZI|nr:hypothetical protein B0H66DRAFT_382704 [Apodospora peruviana]